MFADVRMTEDMKHEALCWLLRAMKRLKEPRSPKFCTLALDLWFVGMKF